MTVSVQTPFKSAVAAGSATFVYDFRTLDASYLVVKVNGVTKTLNTDYTVTGVNAQGGGTVVFGVAPTVGAVVTIQRKTPFQRSTDYQTNGDFMATTVNPDFDALWMALQDTGFLSALAVLLPAGDTAAPMTLPDVTTRASKFLAFDALGNAMAAAGITGAPVSSFMTNVVAALTGAAALGLLGVQTQAATAFPTTGTAPAYVVTASPAVGLTVDTRLQLTFHASTSGACTLAANGTAATAIKQYDSTGAKIDPVIVTNMKADVVYDGTHWVIVDPLPAAGRQIQSLPDPTLSANAMTLPASTHTLDFRSATLTTGVPSTVSGTAAALVIPAGATLGTTNAVQSTLVEVIINNGGTLEKAVVNLAGGNDLSETGVISTTAISAAATAANVFYSTTARSNVPYRVVRTITSTQATAGQWATTPSLVQGTGGEAQAGKKLYPPGSAPVFGARAWAYFNGATTGTNAPLGGGNVASITRNSTGNWTVNFATPMPDANYTVIAMGNNAGNVPLLYTLSANSVNGFVLAAAGYSGGASLDAFIYFAIFR